MYLTTQGPLCERLEKCPCLASSKGRYDRARGDHTRGPFVSSLCFTRHSIKASSCKRISRPVPLSSSSTRYFRNTSYFTMLTCSAGRSLTEFEKSAPEQFFVATAIKACYGKLPDFVELDRFERQTKRAKVESSPSHPQVDRVQVDRGASTVLDTEYRRLYCELRNSALGDMRTLVREHVERMSTPTASYDFMNIYGICSFNPPGMIKTNAAETPVCKFTRVQAGQHQEERLMAVTGILNPLVSPRVQHGELSLSPCQEADYYRAVEEFSRINPRTKMRLPRISHANLGSTFSSLEQLFIFTVREDLHALGCAYRKIALMVETLYLNTLHFLHT